MDDRGREEGGLTGKDNWKRYPRAMLRASLHLLEAIRAWAPDLLGSGVYDETEADEIQERAASSAPRISAVVEFDGREGGAGQGRPDRPRRARRDDGEALRRGPDRGGHGRREGLVPRVVEGTAPSMATPGTRAPSRRWPRWARSAQQRRRPLEPRGGWRRLSAAPGKWFSRAAALLHRPWP